MFTKETAALAGAKGKRGLSERTRILNEFFEDNKDKAQQILQNIQDKALQGDMEAIKLYMGYGFGKPKESMEITDLTPRKEYVIKVMGSNGSEAAIHGAAVGAIDITN